ncbi:MAG: hypothetical protein OIN84_11605, partial [Candidatus Methanoperedens sp.]|nr:hypothetical protein [Candidatus Methanoperedens nitroreducens]MCX9078606.1 hypothetical protein [Candidatus Methanoperedens sp.]
PVHGFKKSGMLFFRSIKFNHERFFHTFHVSIIRYILDVSGVKVLSKGGVRFLPGMNSGASATPEPRRTK